MEKETIDKFNEILIKEGFAKNNDITFLNATNDSCELQMNISSKILNPYGIVHGGAIFGLGDTVMGLTTRLFNIKTVTLNANISYLKPSTGKYLIAKSEVIKKGKNIWHLKADILNDQQILVAIMQGTYFVIDDKNTKR